MRKPQELVARKTDIRIIVLLKVLGILFFCFATAAGALVRIPLPFTPVPLTLQTFFVLLSGLALGSAYGATSMTLYLLFGMLGLPFFAGEASGASWLLGPTGGYLIGFIAASSIAGIAAHPDTKPLLRIGYLILSTMLILIMGTIGLSLYSGQSIISSLVPGVAPFIPGDILKLVTAYGMWQSGKRIVKHVFER